YQYQPGLADAEQVEAWRQVVSTVHEAGGRIVAQLMHAGALAQGNIYRDHTIGPSAPRPKGEQMAFYRGSGPYRIPRAMSEVDLGDAVAGFASAAALAREAGFDGVEIHGANGYLLDQFLTEGINLRQDGYGGSTAGRLRLIVEVVEAVRSAVGADHVVGMRISQAKVNDFLHKWIGGVREAEAVFRALGTLPLDYIHTTEFEGWRPAFGDAGPSLAALARMHARLPVLANGSLHDPQRAAAMIEGDEADLVSLGRGALTHA
ncbi:oxidoreductase, partial [Lysobacter sp. TAB13]|uniref:oxidoreductase n=1 Tax=Lysobacter sp. TAB13 TaxID=3233065 RepID=UPI003F99D884